MKFVDISSNNPHPVNFKALKNAGVDGVRIKATQGDYYTNPDFGSDAMEAAQAGLLWGPYWMWDYTQPIDPQLNYFHEHYGNDGHLFPMIDCETLSGKTCPPWSQMAQDLGRAAFFMVNWYYDTGLYVDQDWKAHLEPFGFPFNRPIWLASGLSLPYDGNVQAVQFEPVTLPGVEGSIDWSIG